MKISKIIKLSAVGLALLLIPRRSSRQSDGHENNNKANSVHDDSLNDNNINDDSLNKDTLNDDKAQTNAPNNN